MSCCCFDGDLNVIEILDGDAALVEVYDGELSEFVGVENSQVYSGPAEFTPSADAQTIHTAGLLVGEDIIIDPIPSNYGLITWNGSTIKVS